MAVSFEEGHMTSPCNVQVAAHVFIHIHGPSRTKFPRPLLGSNGVCAVSRESKNPFQWRKDDGVKANDQASIRNEGYTAYSTTLPFVRSGPSNPALPPPYPSSLSNTYQFHYIKKRKASMSSVKCTNRPESQSARPEVR